MIFVCIAGFQINKPGRFCSAFLYAFVGILLQLAADLADEYAKFSAAMLEIIEHIIARTGRTCFNPAFYITAVRSLHIVSFQGVCREKPIIFIYSEFFRAQGLSY